MVVGVGVDDGDGSVGAVGDGAIAAVAAGADADGTRPTAALGLADGVAEPVKPPPAATAISVASTAATMTRGRRLTAAIVTAGHEERPVRAGGRGVGRCVDGGPDRIRTGDLQRDRLACWAATPRVRCSECGE